MKKRNLIIGIISVLGIVWYLSKNRAKKTLPVLRPVSVKYIGRDKSLGLIAGDIISGNLNDDHSLTYDLTTSSGIKTVIIPAADIADID